MSNYTILTDWVGKDSLSDTDANKVISGSDFQTEFEAVRTAVDSKADSTGNATQTYVTTEIATALTGHATQVAIIGTIYPIGSLYTSTLAENPGTTFNVGTWEAFGEGQVLVGKSDSGTFDTAGTTGGSEEAVLPAHTHEININDGGNPDGSIDAQEEGYWRQASTYGDDETGDNFTLSTGITLAGNENLQPYVVVYMWKRIA